MERILVVDDEDKIRAIIRKYGEFEGYEIAEAHDGMEAVEICRKEDFDLIILDVIMLSARGEEYDKIHGFELGIDDYVVKPFSPRELMMRVKVVISRNNKKDVRDGHEIFQAEGLVVDFTGRTVTVDGKRVEMSPKEYELLFYLVRNRNIALDREKLITEVWGYDYYGDDRTLDTHIKLLRSSLGEYRKFLVTLRGVGYRFEA